MVEFLSLLRLVLRDREIRTFFQQHKVLRTVLAFRSVPGAVAQTYGVLCAFLEAEIEHVLHSGAFQRLSYAKGTAVAVAAEVESSSDDLEHVVLTDEEAFQPKFMKALTLTSVVKEFHEILISRTAKILDLKGREVGETDRLQWEELMHVWRIQVVLIDRFADYQEYAQSKGIPRIVEELFGFLVGLVPRLQSEV